MRYLCIHCHFYQPPRENPWLEAIELQDSAYPYHYWNERITAECYGPNSASRILDSDGNIRKIINNYSQISFNFGPTLLSWAEQKAPELYRLVLEADRESGERFGGHGSAIAQGYNHAILPLCNSRDKRTQVRWGVADFEFRFGRRPEGMWLPETAVDVETLDLLAQAGIRFTILSPYQAKRVRKRGSRTWLDVTGGSIDPTMAYSLTLPSGRKLSLFFYDGPVSRAVAFEGLLTNGEHFAHRILSAASDGRAWEELLHIATDGESYGHHHRHGDMALAYALHHIEANKLACLTNYGQYLERHPPVYDVEILERTSWSCAHGIERWRSDCGCNSGGRPGWRQQWRGPLREALDWLRDDVAPRYEERAKALFKDPWEARECYIDVALDRSPENREKFLAGQAARELSADEQVTAWRLLELERHAMLMYTSCGWFFDELSGPETVQVIQYAGRVVQLAERLFDRSFESEFLARLEKAKSNIAEHRDGANIYEKFVKPTVVNLAKVGAHYGISSMFHSYPERTRIFCYTADRQHYVSLDAGRMKLGIGRARLTSEVTQDTDLLTFGFLHFGDHNITGGVRQFRGEAEYEALVASLTEHFSRADVPEVMRLLDRGFGGNIYSLRTLFRDEQRRILNEILTQTLSDAEAVYRQLYENQAPLMRFLADLKTPPPRAFQTTAEYALNSQVRSAVEEDEPDLRRIRGLLAEVRQAQVALDRTTLEFTFRRAAERLSDRLYADNSNLEHLKRLDEFVKMIGELPFPVVLWSVQNQCWDLASTAYREMMRPAERGDEAAEDWILVFRSLADRLALRFE